MVVVHKEEARGRRRRRSSSSSPSSSSLWVFLLVLSQLISLSLAVHQEEEIPTNSKLLVGSPSLGRKAKLFFHYKQSSTRVEESFPGAPSPAQVGGGQDKVYEDDKRLVHTGPNPLHN